MGCHDATARRPYPADGNIRLSSDVTFTSTARLVVGRPFGVTTYQANRNQQKFGVGRRYYLPTADDVARVRRLFPDLPNPENPNWLAISNKLRGNGHADLAKLTPPELLALLDTTETPPVAERARLNAAPSSTSAPPNGTQQGEGEANNRAKGIPLAEAEILVRDWLLKYAKDNPAGITRDAVAAGIDVSAGQVSKTAAWKAFRERRDAEAKPGAREVPLTDAMQAVVPGDCETPDELAALIEEQRADEAEENRRHNRRHKPS
jgi:hypothetical protein